MGMVTSHSFCDTILQEKGGFFYFFFNQLLLQSILGPLRDAATLQVKSNAPSSEPFVKH